LSNLYFVSLQRVSVILGLFACLPLTSSANQDVQARFEKSLKDARALTNVEVQMLETLIYPSSPKERDFSSTFQYTYIASGPKFRANCKLVSAVQMNTRKRTEAAFNGTSFVTYNADTRSMTRRDALERQPQARGPMRSMRHGVPAANAGFQSRVGAAHFAGSADSARTMGRAFRPAAGRVTMHKDMLSQACR
jgi:hypothetical protein